jgi:esterase/lipase superfamily enzyme
MRNDGANRPKDIRVVQDRSFRSRCAFHLGCRWRRGLALLLYVAFISGCGGHPKGVLSPVENTSTGASKITMLVATTRSRSDVRGEMFTGERAVDPSFAEITVSVPGKRNRKIGEVAWPKKLPPNPETDFATLMAEEVSAEDAKKWLNASVAKNSDKSGLIFIHGFNNRVEDSVYRFAQIVEDSGIHSTPVLATWPSRGSLLAYGYDRESTNHARNALESLFQDMAKDEEIGEVFRPRPLHGQLAGA